MRRIHVTSAFSVPPGRWASEARTFWFRRHHGVSGSAAVINSSSVSDTATATLLTDSVHTGRVIRTSLPPSGLIGRGSRNDGRSRSCRTLPNALAVRSR